MRRLAIDLHEHQLMVRYFCDQQSPSTYKIFPGFLESQRGITQPRKSSLTDILNRNLRPEVTQHHDTSLLAKRTALEGFNSMASLYFSMESEYFSFLKSWFASAFRSSDRATSASDGNGTAAASAGGDDVAFSSPDIAMAGGARRNYHTSCWRWGDQICKL